jgi:hypothetical protein
VFEECDIVVCNATQLREGVQYISEECIAFGVKDKAKQEIDRSRWQAQLVSCLAYSLTLKMERICSSEISGFR